MSASASAGRQADATPEIYESLARMERELLEKEPMTLGQVRAWIDLCLENSSDATCFGGQTGRPDSMARRLRAIVNQILGALIFHAELESERSARGIAGEALPDVLAGLEGKGTRLLKLCEDLLGSEVFCSIELLGKYEEVHDHCVTKNRSIDDCFGAPTGQETSSQKGPDRVSERMRLELEVIRKFGYLRKIDALWLNRLVDYLGSRSF